MSILPFFIVVPFLASLIAVLIAKRGKSANDIFMSLVAFFMMSLSFYAIGAINKAGMMVYKIGGWQQPLGISLVADGLTALLLVVINTVSFMIALYSVNYMERYISKWRFWSLFMLMIGGMNGVVLTGDIFNLYIFFEITSIASYALIAFGVESEELEASFKYAVISSVGSAFILLGIAFLYSYTSTLNMADMANVLAAKGAGRVLPFVSILFIVGFGLKAALVPFHSWLPDAHPAAPAPISAMLSSVMIKTLGVYAICRLFFNVIGASPIYLLVFMVLGTLSMIVGAVGAIGQWDLKRLFAYSSISQIGYIFLGLGLGTPLGILGALFHLFNHAMFKSLLFLNSGAVEYATGTRDLEQMGGLAEKMPVTSKTSLIGALSISGVPPYSGFWSKLVIIFACVQARHYGYALVAVLVSIVTLAYLMKVQKYAFYSQAKDALAAIKEVPVFMRVSMVLLATICIFAGLLLIPMFKDSFLEFSVKAIAIGTGYAKAVLGGM